MLHCNLEMTYITIGHADTIIELSSGIELAPIQIFLLYDFCYESLQYSNKWIRLILAVSVKPVIYLPVDSFIFHQVHYEGVVDQKLNDSQGYFMPQRLLFWVELKLLVGEE